METDYESKVQKKKAIAAARTGIITILICLFVLIPLIEYWEMTSQMRNALRSGKNVLLNIELISLEHFGMGRSICDLSRESGLTKDAEEKVINFSGAEGIIRLQEWDQKKHVVLRMTYIQDGFILEYRRLSEEEIQERAMKGENTTGEWRIYHMIRQYDATQTISGN